MLKKLDYTVPKSLLERASHNAKLEEFRYTINQPTGRFFYDPWEIKPQLKGTVWEDILNSLSVPAGEARIVTLPSTHSYQIHADIDDRYHLNIKSEACYLIDFDSGTLHPIETDGIWYEMDAGRLHTASNFGRDVRIQLVVRKLLNDSDLKDPVKIRIISVGLDKDDARFIFDNILSPWFNMANKHNFINDFKFSTNEVTCNVESDMLDNLRTKLTENFHLEIL